MEEAVTSGVFFQGNTVVAPIEDNEALEVEAAPLVAVVLPGQTLPVVTGGSSMPQQLSQVSIAPPALLPPAIYVCSEETCLEEFPTLKELKRHSKSHAEDKPHKCDQCSASFNVEYNLTLHKAIHQKGQLECPDCSKKFSRLASLKAHIMMHEREESLICPECGDEFCLQRELSNHMQGHKQTYTRNRVGEYPCKQCSEVFPLHQQLKEHVRVIHKMNYRSRRKGTPSRYYPNNACPHCIKSFPKPSQLVRHIRIHTGEKPFSCHLCQKSFNQKGALNIHMMKHTKLRPYACELCPLSFSQRGNLRAHVLRLHELNSKLKDPHRCEECNCVFRKLGSLRSHMSRFHSSTESPLALLRLGALRLNRQLAATGTSANELLSSSEGGIVSLPDLATVTTVTSVNQDEDAPVNIMDIPVEDLPPVPMPPALPISTPPFPAPPVPVPPTTEEHNSTATHSTLDQSLNDIILKLLELTQQAGDTTEGIDEEEESRTGSFSTDILEQALEDCGLQTNRAVEQPLPETPAKTAEDVVRVFTEILARRRAMRSNTGRTHTCRFCQKDFKKPSDLVRHIRTHTQERPFKCQLCMKTFTVKSTLTTHLKTHTGLKEYKCNVCLKMFSTHSSLKIHLRLHTGAKPFECTQCSKRFRTSGQRNVHLAAHSRAQNPSRLKAAKAKAAAALSDTDLQYISLPEPILITDTGLVQQLSRNNAPLLESVHYPYDRPYKCGFCGKAFKKSSHLKQHIRTHTGERPFRCHQCNKSFVSSGVLRSHLRVHTGDKAFKCIICERLFTTNGSLKRHMATHSDVRPFMCPFCQKTFKTSLNCKKHMKTHKLELFEGSLPQVQETVVPPGGNAIVEAMPPDQSQDITEQFLNQLEVDALRAQHGESTQIPLLEQTSLTQEVLSQASLGGPANLTNVSQFVQGLVSQEMIVGGNHGSLPPPPIIVDTGLVSLETREIQQQLEEITGQSLLPLVPPPPPPVDPPTSLPPPPPPQLPPPSLQSVQLQPAMLPQDPLPTGLGQENVQESVQESVQVDMFPMLTASKVSPRRLFQCEHCPKTFKKSSHLKQHVNSTHKGLKPHQCPECPKSFVSASVLRTHLVTHTGMRPYECGSCGAVFSTNGSLSRHMAIHTSERLHRCTQCSSSFRTASQLHRHERSHEERAYDPADPEPAAARKPPRVHVLDQSEKERLAREAPQPGAPLSEKILAQLSTEGDKIHEIVDRLKQLEGAPRFANACDRCPKTFRKHCDLVRHIRIHTGEKPFSCELCGKAFAVKSTLSCHKRTHKGLKQASCHICQTMFATVGSLKVHMRLHTGAKPYKCPKCPKFFRTSGSRKVHMESHQPVRTQTRLQEGVVEVDHGPPFMEGGMEQIAVVQSITCDSVDPSLQQVLVSHEVPISTGSLSSGGIPMADGLVTTSMVPIELQLNMPTFSQNMQVSGMNSNVTVQIDPSLLQQLQLQQQNSMVSQQMGGDVGCGQINFQLAGNDVIGNQLVTLQPDGGPAEPPPMILQLDPASLQQLAQMNVTTVQPQLTFGPEVQLQLQATEQPLLETTQQPDGTIILSQGGEVFTQGAEVLTQGAQITLPHGSILPTSIAAAAASQSTPIDLSSVEVQAVQQAMVTTGTEPQATTTTTAGTGLISGLPISAGPDGLSVANTDNFQLSIPGDSLRPIQSPTPQRGSQVPPMMTPPPGGRDTDVLVGEIFSPGLLQGGLRSMEDAVGESMPSSSMMTPNSGSVSGDGDSGGGDENSAHNATSPLQTPPSTPNKRRRKVVDKPTLSVADAAAAIGSLYACEMPACSEEFTTMSELRAHQESQHKSLRPHQCPVCHKAFKRSTHLKEHVEIHNPDRQANQHSVYPCRFCNKTFSKPSLVERHLRSHTGDRPFDCPECGKSFTQKNSLTTHMKTHTKEKPYSCQYCSHNFSQKANMKTHIQRQHKKELAADKMAGKSLQGSSSDTNQGSTSGTDRDDTLDIEGVMSRFFP